MPEKSSNWEQVNREEVEEARRSGDFEIGFLCVFCGLPASEEAADFCPITVSGDWGFTQFTAHAECFRSASADPEHFPTLGPTEPPPDYVPPPQELRDAWEELEKVLADIGFAELEDAEQVRAVTRSVREAAEANGVSFQDR